MIQTNATHDRALYTQFNHWFDVQSGTQIDLFYQWKKKLGRKSENTMSVYCMREKDHVRNKHDLECLIGLKSKVDHDMLFHRSLFPNDELLQSEIRTEAGVSSHQNHTEACSEVVDASCGCTDVTSINFIGHQQKVRASTSNPNYGQKTSVRPKLDSRQGKIQTKEAGSGTIGRKNSLPGKKGVVNNSKPTGKHKCGVVVSKERKAVKCSTKLADDDDEDDDGEPAGFKISFRLSTAYSSISRQQRQLSRPQHTLHRTLVTRRDEDIMYYYDKIRAFLLLEKNDQAPEDDKGMNSAAASEDDPTQFVPNSTRKDSLASKMFHLTGSQKMSFGTSRSQDKKGTVSFSSLLTASSHNSSSTIPSYFSHKPTRSTTDQPSGTLSLSDIHSDKASSSSLDSWKLESRSSGKSTQTPKGSLKSLVTSGQKELAEDEDSDYELKISQYLYRLCNCKALAEVEPLLRRKHSVCLRIIHALCKIIIAHLSSRG